MMKAYHLTIKQMSIYKLQGKQNLENQEYRNNQKSNQFIKRGN